MWFRGSLSSKSNFYLVSCAPAVLSPIKFKHQNSTNETFFFYLLFFGYLVTAALTQNTHREKNGLRDAPGRLSLHRVQTPSLSGSPVFFFLARPPGPQAKPPPTSCGCCFERRPWRSMGRRSHAELPPMYMSAYICRGSPRFVGQLCIDGPPQQRAGDQEPGTKQKDRRQSEHWSKNTCRIYMYFILHV